VVNPPDFHAPEPPLETTIGDLLGGSGIVLPFVAVGKHVSSAMAHGHVRVLLAVNGLDVFWSPMRISS
jgi:hypothetical protein